MPNTLYLIRGCPGAGKSTFAKELELLIEIGCGDYGDACAVEADNFFISGEGDYRFDAKKLHAAHEWCRTEVEHRLRNGYNVIVSNTSTTEKEVKVYQDLAEKYGAKFVSLIVENRHNGVNLHGVPEENVQQMRNRFSIKL